jgi:hypothetical protein
MISVSQVGPSLKTRTWTAREWEHHSLADGTHSGLPWLWLPLPLSVGNITKNSDHIHSFGQAGPEVRLITYL